MEQPITVLYLMRCSKFTFSILCKNPTAWAIDQTTLGIILPYWHRILKVANRKCGTRWTTGERKLFRIISKSFLLESDFFPLLINHRQSRGSSFFFHRQCDQISPNFAIWQYFNSLRRLCERLLNVGQNFEPPSVNILCHWANFHFCKWPNIKKNLAIWSHCRTTGFIGPTKSWVQLFWWESKEWKVKNILDRVRRVIENVRLTD